MKRRRKVPNPKDEVCGTDDLGDVHTFATDDRERAEEVKAIRGEDLEDVELKETASEWAASASSRARSFPQAC